MVKRDVGADNSWILWIIILLVLVDLIVSTAMFVSIWGESDELSPSRATILPPLVVSCLANCINSELPAGFFWQDCYNPDIPINEVCAQLIYCVSACNTPNPSG